MKDKFGREWELVRLEDKKTKLKKEIEYIKKHGAGNWLSRRLLAHLENKLNASL